MPRPAPWSFESPATASNLWLERYWTFHLQSYAVRLGQTTRFRALSERGFAIAQQLGVHPLHFGTVMVIAMGLGLFSPPVGLGLFATCAITGT